MLQYQGCGHLPHSLPGPPTPQKPPGPQWPQWFSWGLPAGARGHAVAPSFKRHAGDAGVGRSPAIQLHAPVLRQGNPLTSPRAPSLPPRRLSPGLFCLSLAVSGRLSLLFCIPPGPITPCGVPIPRCGDPAGLPVPQSETPAHLPLRLFQDSGPRCMEKPGAGSFYSGLSPGRRKPKGVPHHFLVSPGFSPPFPGVLMCHSVLKNTCQTPSLHAKLQFSSFWVNNDVSISSGKTPMWRWRGEGCRGRCCLCRCTWSWSGVWVGVGRPARRSPGARS